MASGEEGTRVVTDSVHGRFRPTYVHCDACRSTFLGNHVEIEKHFQPPHPSNFTCFYCQGKVFVYYSVGQDGNAKSRKYHFHRCPRNRSSK